MILHQDIKIILNKISYLDKFMNTSFIEVLNPFLYKNMIHVIKYAWLLVLQRNINNKEIYNTWI